MDQVARVALERVEAERHHLPRRDRQDRRPRERGHGPDVSREGVQRDLLPIVEGTTVNTRYGLVRTDHILFIAAGAFHVSKPSRPDARAAGPLPHPRRAEPLTIDDFLRILTEPKNALIKQYTALLETEGIELDFTDDAIEAHRRLRRPRQRARPRTSAPAGCTRSWRRCSRRSPSKAPTSKEKHRSIDAAYVEKQLADIVQNEDLSRYIL